MQSPSLGHGHTRKSDTTYPTDVAERSNVNIDKISTMTLAEFKSMLSSSLSAPEEQKHVYRELPEGRSSEQSQGMSSSAADNWNFLHQKASSLSDSSSSDAFAKHTAGCGPGGNEESAFCINRPKTPKVLQRNTEESNTADMLRPKTPTSFSRLKMPKPSSELERTAPKEEYKMARPKPASQIKRDAVAKVAGAISNWVESRNGADTADTTSCRPKTPTRPKTLVGPHSSFHQDLLQEDDEEELLDTADIATNSLMQSLANASRDRPVTPSRIPKPSFIPRPKTPSSFTAESPGDTSSQPPSTPNLTRLNIALANRPTALSRSNSNSSSVKSVDETPVSPASSFSEDKMYKGHSRARRLSNSSDGFNASSSAVMSSSISSSGRSYKEIYVAKKAATSGTDGRVPPTRAVTPGPREKWTLGGGGGVPSTEGQNPVPNTQRRRSINTMCKTDCHVVSKPATPESPIRRTSSTSNIEVEQPMTITNEITFSDDEEINEIIKNAALRVKKQNVRSSSVGARKYAHQQAKQNEEEVLMICRDQNMKDTVINNTASKYNIVRRPSSRGSSNGRASPVTVVSRFSQATGSSLHQQKTQPVPKSKRVDGRDSPVSSSQPAHKSRNRTEAWVDTTLSDDKKKPLPLPKQIKTQTIAAQDLASRPLEEIQAILSEPKNGFANVDARGLEPPPEDPAMYRKMEKLFEKYREMELKASMNEVLRSGGVRTAMKEKLADAQSTKSDSHRLVQGASKPFISVASLKISSGSTVSASGHSSGQNTAVPSSIRTSSNESYKVTKSSSTPGPFQNTLHQTSTSNSSVLEPAYQESKDYFNLDNSSNTKKSKTPEPESDHKGLGILQDIDPELAKNPAALISKIKEILKVRPRKDENTKGPTRIPAPATLNRRNRSKSVSNLYSDCMFDANSDSGHDLNESQPDGKSDSHNIESHSYYDDERSLKTSTNLASENTASFVDDSADNVPDLMPVSVNFDSNDSQNRSETPVPKLATPLTTGRSTLISRKSEKFARNMSQDKENMSTSQSTISGLSVLTPTEDQVDFV